MDLAVLAAGDRFVVVDKPSGLAVHRSAEVRDRHTVMGAVRKRMPEIPRIDAVHRLDRATSGCLLLSLDPAHTPVLHAGLKEGLKVYLAAVRGRVSPLEPVHYEGALKDDLGQMKEAETVFIPVATCAEPRCSLLLAIPLTGRRHQIRRHLRDLAHPVLGDSSHGDTRVNRAFREAIGLDRLALHCIQLEIELPDTGERIRAQSPLPPELRCLEKLPLWPDALAALPELRRVP